MSINNSALPLREQAANFVRERIESGYYAPGHKIRGSELQQELDMSRGTISNALYDLGEEGVIYSKARNASWVVVGEVSQWEELHEEAKSLTEKTEQLASLVNEIQESLLLLAARVAQQRD